MRDTHKTAIKGISYETILPPSVKIEKYLNALERSLIEIPSASEGMQKGVQLALSLARIWFEDEIKVINITKN